ncbi:MAG: DUF1015 domain-containing protein [Chloroflexi bacterium]|nr:DUF1015 domain-containing protein [Chloroflexota bacterium]
MAELRPFRGIRYNQTLVGDLAAVICPPYDIISPQLQQELHRRSKYNFVRVEYGRELPQDTAADNKYTRAAATIEQWLEQGVLAIDKTPAIYLHDHYFIHEGRRRRRRGIAACIRLEEWDRMVVRPHEGTLARPKSDRMSLLRACQANISPILALFEDREGTVSSLLSTQGKKHPVLNPDNADGDSHQVRAITEPGAVEEICRCFADRPVYIADGHHRYESALAYRRERLSSSPAASPDEGFNFVMMTLVDFSDPGLVILPPHRLVRGISKSTLSGLMGRLKSFFEMEELPLDKPDVWREFDDLLTGVRPGDTGQVRLGLFGPAAERVFVLRLLDFASARQLMPQFHSELYQKLDVSILDHLILEKLLGVEGEEMAIGYSYDKRDAVRRVLDQEYQLAFLLSPVRPEVIKAIADAGDRMPRKSTYFYPKLPAGLVFRRLV